MKPMKLPKIAVLVPCYKRKEYTKKCLESLEKTNYDNCRFFLVDAGSQDGTNELLKDFKHNRNITVYKRPIGLRDIIIEFFSRTDNYEYIAKMDNDCTVEPDWLLELLKVYENTEVDMLSPNVFPSNAAERIGRPAEGFLRADTVGGLWFMRRSLIEGMDFEKTGMVGVYGAHALVEQIQIDTDAVVGWTTDVTVNDLGHWSGLHPEHIKSDEHAEYSEEVGRKIAW